MLILLPPSEGKTPSTGSVPLALRSLVFADDLTPSRERLIRALEKLSQRPVKKALEVMAISPGQAGDIALNGEIMSAPAGPASEVYTGVLYERLGLGTMGTRGVERAVEHLLIASGLWGMLRPNDRIPYYRLSMKPKLARVGGLGAFWRKPLEVAMRDSGFDEPGEIVLDMRSGSYQSVWKPKLAELVAVRGFTEANGQRKVISHMAKAIRGDVARLVLNAAEMPTDAEAVAEVLTEAGLRVELGDGTIDVIEEA
ncbi:MAG TPA: peroxide stress protein YaaA [Solirubrobacterales bacterium]|nr:peroxide stress protein YaaA [Solirubrobacterales bacterium]